MKLSISSDPKATTPAVSHRMSSPISLGALSVVGELAPDDGIQFESCGDRAVVKSNLLKLIDGLAFQTNLRL